MVEEGLPNVGNILGPGYISWVALKAIGNLCYRRMVNLVLEE